MFKSANMAATHLIALAQKAGTAVWLGLIITLLLFIASAILHEFGGPEMVANMLFWSGFAGIIFTSGVLTGRSHK